MTDLSIVKQLIPLDHGLSVIITTRPNGTPQTSVVNAGVMAHPLGGTEVLAFVAAGRARKLTNLRARPGITVVVRAGWQWASVDGTAELIGPDDPHDDVDAERLRLLLREIFTAAGGTHDDWETYDRVMREERRTAVLVTSGRVYSNPA
jgi:PPOX class probable F420-dependent enzyme